MKNNEIAIYLQKGRSSVTGSLYQYDYGQRLLIHGVTLPETYEVHFANQQTGESKTAIGDSTGVMIPDEYLLSGENIHVWIYLHDGADDGETEYHGIINVTKRARPTDQEPTPVQQDVITQAIAALNTAVEKTEESEKAAEDAANSVKNAGATAETLAPGSTATVVVKDVNGVKTFEFGIPEGQKGEKGDTGEQGPKGDKGDPGEVTQAEFGGVTPGMYGAAGDGITDDTQAFLDMLDAAPPYIFIPAGVYNLSLDGKRALRFENTHVYGTQRSVLRLLSHPQTADGWGTYEHAFVFTGKCFVDTLTFETVPETGKAYQTPTGARVNASSIEIINCRDSTFRNIVWYNTGRFDYNVAPIDLYSNCQNILFENLNIEMFDSVEGGCWVREANADKITENITFDNCIFDSTSLDEAVAVWGWQGKVRNVVMNNTIFRRSHWRDEGAVHNPHMLTLSSGNGDSRFVRINACQFYMNAGTTGSIVKANCSDAIPFNNVTVTNCNFYVTRDSEEDFGYANGFFNTESAKQRIYVDNCYFYTECTRRAANSENIFFNGCVFRSAVQFAPYRGRYINCVFDNNPDVTFDSQYMFVNDVSLENCVFNGLNLSGTAFMIQVTDDGRTVRMKNVTTGGVLTGNARLLFSNREITVDIDGLNALGSLYIPEASGAIRNTVIRGSYYRNNIPDTVKQYELTYEGGRSTSDVAAENAALIAQIKTYLEGSHAELYTGDILRFKNAELRNGKTIVLTNSAVDENGVLLVNE